MKPIISVFFMALLGYTASYTILGIFPYMGKSHFIMFEALFEALAEQGHDVHIVSHFPKQSPTPRYVDLSLRGSIPLLLNNISFEFISSIQGVLAFTNFVVEEVGLNNCKIAFNTPVLQELKKSETKYDLVVTQLLGCDCMLGFGYIFKAPVITITANTNFPWGGDRFGNPDNPSYIPNYFALTGSRMSVLERLKNTMVLLVTKFKYFRSANAANALSREFFGQALPDLRELAYNTSLMLINSHFSIDGAVPNVPNIIEVAGMHISPLKLLPKHLEEVMNVTSNYKGVIYLSMGSMFLTETMPIDKLTAFLDAFRELPYKVLWKANIDKMPAEIDIPPNIHFESWMPQFDILCHPNTKLFLSHGGIMGTQEALYCGVPRIGIPLFGDQEVNLRTSEAMGTAIVIYFEDLTKHNILTSLKQILENTNYSSNAKNIAERFKDRPLSPLDTAIYWVEYVIRHKGAPHLRSVGAELPWYQYFLLDVGAILLEGFIMLLMSIYYMFVFVLRALYFVITIRSSNFKED